MSDWFNHEEGTTHYCGGHEDKEKNNKPKGTQVEMTKWFNPTTLDTETNVRTCVACGTVQGDTNDG
jgi:hypothetical protein